MVVHEKIVAVRRIVLDPHHFDAFIILVSEKRLSIVHENSVSVELEIEVLREVGVISRNHLVMVSIDYL